MHHSPQLLCSTGPSFTPPARAEELAAPQWFVVLPRQCDLRVEIERLLLCLPHAAKICLMKGPDHKSLMDRTDFGIGIQTDDAFFLRPRVSNAAASRCAAVIAPGHC